MAVEAAERSASSRPNTSQPAQMLLLYISIAMCWWWFVLVGNVIGRKLINARPG